MMTSRDSTSTTALMSLEAAAASARAGFACMFSSSDEYETALITERRAQGRYGAPHSKLPVIAFIGCCVMVVGTVLLFV
ncbi:MAG: hypothetical protein V4477_15185 [Pseudomonadota bacterium]|uniref:hypothetical protein n=1 Tax=Tardiphaga sp. TaxID=1926292 RepID=UPI0033513066